MALLFVRSMALTNCFLLLIWFSNQSDCQAFVLCSLQTTNSPSILSAKPTRDSLELLQQQVYYTLMQLNKLEGSFVFDSQSILHSVDRRHSIDATACADLLETETTAAKTSPLPYQWIHKGGRPVAIRTMKPVLSPATVEWIRKQAQDIWNNENDTFATSRFTYQRKGNYEVHLTDLLNQARVMNENNQEKVDSIQQALQNKIYSTIHDAFDSSLIDNGSSLSLCVYDALVIRYNATERLESQTLAGFIGAGQPLHRDLGLVSVNIMLNDEQDFSGGGTFFEHQLENMEDCNPLKPLGPGHALMHLSSDRHAGAGTKQGVRDILVMFITAKKKKSPFGAPRLERAARLKATARSNCQECENETSNGSLNAALCRAYYQYLAVQANAQDGEAWQYLGMAIWDVYRALAIILGEGDIQNYKNTQTLCKQLVEISMECMHQAAIFTPGDARIFNNLGLIQSGILSSPELMTLLQIENKRQHEAIIESYEKSLRLQRRAKIAGCDVGIEYDSTILNYGLYLSNQDMFEAAALVLDSIDFSEEDFYDTTRSRISEDSKRLLQFCQRQLSK